MSIKLPKYIIFSLFNHDHVSCLPSFVDDIHERALRNFYHPLDLCLDSHELNDVVPTAVEEQCHYYKVNPTEVNYQDECCQESYNPSVKIPENVIEIVVELSHITHKPIEDLSCRGSSEKHQILMDDAFK